MVSGDGTVVVTFNGEIYNFGALREELEPLGHRFRGHSDTEILLAAVEQWGVLPALQRFNGMFAFALWDRRHRRLHLARDRMGEKPLYYGWFGDTFLFGSEIKAVRAHPRFTARLDRGALALFMRHEYVPAPYSIYEGLRKLEPGGLLTVSPDAPGEAKLERYWSHREAAERGLAHRFPGDRREAVDALEALLRDAVKLRMESDVPLGTFLSGGVDSSTVTALMQAQSARPVKTFTIGFREAAFNEADHAKAVAAHLGTEHTELYVSPQDALDVVPRLPVLYDEPFSDVSQIPTFLVAQLARRHVTVSLSGDGGDELFCGYDRYELAARIWSRLRLVPAELRAVAGRALLAGPHRVLHGIGVRGEWPARLEARAGLLQGRSSDEVYRTLLSHWKDPGQLVLGGVEPPTLLSDPRDVPAFPSLRERMMFVDALTYLPDCILTKVDRASMGVSLEARVPLLDHRLVELAWSFPLEVKLRRGETKWALRQVLHRHVPRALIERPKMGFGVPIAAWLRGPLRAWAEDLLSEARLRRQGLLDAGVVQATLRDHVDAGRDNRQRLWQVLMFQAWLGEASTPVSRAA